MKKNITAVAALAAPIFGPVRLSRVAPLVNLGHRPRRLELIVKLLGASLSK